ncbi:MAG TPA: LytTR family DNA-binding domain-containing protein [Bacteroidales bacterium]|nr:LytTR family DNA-binding domain-containing protein [Bacteroidales bacterium]
MKHNCIIVDDEPLAIEVIKSHIGNMGLFNVIAECNNAVQAFQALKNNRIDLMFLDIQMPGMKGTDFLRNLIDPPKVILITAYRDYAFDGYELNVVDYLLKPVSYDRFVRAIDKFLNSESRKSGIQDDEKFIYLNINKKIHKIFINEIIYAESIKDYLTIHTVSGEIIAKHTITAFESLVPPEDFVRIHRSFIVSINKIKSFNAHSVDIGGKELPVGQIYQPGVFEKLRYPFSRI